MHRKANKVRAAPPISGERLGGRALARIVSLVMVIFGLELLANAAGSIVNFDSQQKSWTIDNGKISLVYHFDDVHGTLQLLSLKNLSAGTQWVGDRTKSVFQLRFTEEGRGDQSLDSRSGWQLEEWTAHFLDEGRSELVIRMANARAQVALELHAECAPGYPVIRRWWRIENRSKQKRVLRDVSIVSDPIRWVDTTELLTYKFDTHDHGSFLRPAPPVVEALPSVERVTGSLDYSPMMLLRATNRSGLFWGWAYSGRTHFGVLPSTGRPRDPLSGLFHVNFLSSSEPQNGEDVLSYHLDPGESFTTPEQFVGVFQGDWDEGSYQMQHYADRWFSGISAQNPRYPLTLMDSWVVYSIREDELKAVVDWASQAGVEAMDIDYGWAIAGDWKPRTVFYPSGTLAGLADYASRKNVKLTVHMPLGDLDHGSEVYKKHPDWAYGKPWKLWKDEVGRESLESTLCITNEEARTWMMNRISDTLSQNRLIGFALDAFLFSHENVPCPFRSGDALKAAPEYSRYVFGLYRLMEGLFKRQKDLVIENAGGIMGPPVYDFATARWFRHMTTTVSLPGDSLLEHVRANYYITYLVSLGWPADYYGNDYDDFNIRMNLLGGAFYLELNPKKLNPQSQALIIKYIHMFKEIRSWTSNGKVLHLMDPGRSPHWNGWAALGDYNPEADRAIVVVWHFQSPQKEMTIPMKALKPDHQYTVSYSDSGRTSTASGQEIMRDGFQLSLNAYESSKDKSSEIIFVNPSSGTAEKTEAMK